MQDKNLFAKTFKKSLLGRDSWAVWKVFLAALFGLGLTPKQRETYYQHTKRTDIPSKPFREAFLICGRRSGKSIVAALIAVWLAIFVDHSASLVPGESAMVLVLSSDRHQAQIIFRYIVAFLQTPLLRNMIVGEMRKESVDLSNGITISIATSSFRSVRGFTIVGVIMDELAFWSQFDTSGKNPDSEIFSAVRPAMISIPKAMLIAVSSPYGQTGELWRAYNLHYGQPSDTLIWQAPSLEMNPTLPRSEVERAYQKDPLSARSEYGAEFRESVSEFISAEMIAARVAQGVHQRAYEEGRRYVSFCDTSSGKGDSAVLAIAHFERDRAVLDLLREIAPPFNPASALREFAGVLKAYRCLEVFGDRYAIGFAGEIFEKSGIVFRQSERSRSQIYLEFLPHILSGGVVLLDNEKMQKQFVGLERKPGRNTDSVDHEQSGHDDCSNAVAGAVLAVMDENGGGGSLGLLDYEKQISSGVRRDPTAERPRKPPKTRSEAPRPQDGAPEPCPLCGQRRVWMSAGTGRLVAHCNQDGSDNGVVAVTGAEYCPNRAGGHDMSQWAGGKPRCAACGWQPGANVVLAGSTFADLKRGRGSFGRFS
jgi:hypothetical protein